MKKYGFISIALCSAIALLICYSPVAKTGAIQGIQLCENTIIPALLPILILTNIIVKSKCSVIFEKLFGGITTKLFKLPKCCAPAILFGLIGGYPAGAVLTEALYNSSLIDNAAAKRMMRFNFSGGLAFIITAVGAMRYGSAKTGLMLYLSCTLPAILIGLFSALAVDKAPECDDIFRERLNFNEALTSSVDTAAKSIISMCAYIILFSSFCALVPIPSYITPVFEITNGLCDGSLIPLDYAAFFLAFGGLCIHFQIMNYTRGYWEFLIFRFINALLSYLIMHIYLAFNPTAQNVFSNISGATAKLTQANAGFGIIMIFGCAVIILDIENRKLKLHN